MGRMAVAVGVAICRGVPRPTALVMVKEAAAIAPLLASRLATHIEAALGLRFSPAPAVLGVRLNRVKSHGYLLRFPI